MDNVLQLAYINKAGLHLLLEGFAIDGSLRNQFASLGRCIVFFNAKYFILIYE